VRVLEDITKSKTQRRTLRSIVACFAVLALSTGLDLWSKDWALDRLSRAASVAPGPVCEANDQDLVYFQRIQRPPLVLIDGYLELRYAENCGAAFGVLHGASRWLRLLVFAPAAIAATLGLLWLYFRGYGGRLFAISVPLIASGALGNLVDRFRLGYVVDFIRFHVRDAFVWPTFNIADCTITVGVALLVIEGFAAPKPSAPAPTRRVDAPQPGRG
jgi:signal peptidase II